MRIWCILSVILIKSVQFSSVIQSCLTLCDPMSHATSLSITISRSSLKLMSIESVMPSSHLILCCTLLLLPPIPPSIRVWTTSREDQPPTTACYAAPYAIMQHEEATLWRRFRVGRVCVVARRNISSHIRRMPM